MKAKQEALDAKLEAQKAVEAAQAAAADEDRKALLRRFSVKQLRAYCQQNEVDCSEAVEKQDLVAKAASAAGTGKLFARLGVAWLEKPCSKCGAKKEPKGGVVCFHRRSDGVAAGCGEGVCWRC